MKLFQKMLAFYIGFSLLSTAFAEDDKSIYYILDGSGSMWARISGETKIDIAKKALSSMIDQTPEHIKSGLMVYGHRRKGDCSDIEELSPLASVDKKLLLKQIQSISPRGMTPISDSILEASKRVSTALSSTIVLVSDGIETCSKDPCLVAKEAKEKNIKLIVHVVGFDLKNKDEQKLHCIAENTGGKYFPASKASDIMDALSKIKESVVENKPIEVAPPKEQAPEITEQPIQTNAKSVRVKVKGPGRLKLVVNSKLEPPYYWKLADAESGKEKYRFSDLGEQVVEAGNYQVIWKQTEHGAIEVNLGELVSISSGTLTELPLSTYLNPIAADWLPSEIYYWKLDSMDNKQTVAKFSGKLETQLVPPGNYNLFLRLTEHGSNDSFLGAIEIKPSQINNFEINTGITLTPPPNLDKPYRIKYYLKDSNDPAVFLRDSFGPIALSPGTYKVTYQQKEHGSPEMVLVEELNVASGSLVELEL